MKEKKMFVMTDFGPVPYDAVKEHLPKEIMKAIESYKEAVENSVPMSIDYYASSLAKKKGWKPEKMANYLGDLWDINPAAVFSTILREIAIELDKKYKNHINDCEELFIISTMDGRIHNVPRAHIKNFRNFAAFRTVEDAKIACRILRNDLKEMFKSVKK